MTHILAISSSPNPAASKTQALIDQFIRNWTLADGDTEVTYRDLADSPPPHLDGQTIGAFFTPAEELSAAQRDLLRYSDTAVAELERADIVLIGAPMHNFSIPSALKAWIDNIARVGKTFRYTENGPQGLLKGKQVIVLAARGGDYSKTSGAHAMDHQTPYLKTVLGFVGLDDVTFIHAEGVATGADGFMAAKKKVAEYVSGANSKAAA